MNRRIPLDFALLGLVCACPSTDDGGSQYSKFIAELQESFNLFCDCSEELGYGSAAECKEYYSSFEYSQSEIDCIDGVAGAQAAIECYANTYAALNECAAMFSCERFDYESDEYAAFEEECREIFDRECPEIPVADRISILGCQGVEAIACDNFEGEEDVGVLCDGFAACADSSDEPDTCPTFTCGDGSEISEAWVCDDFADCEDESDEANCSTSSDEPIVPLSFQPGTPAP